MDQAVALRDGDDAQSEARPVAAGEVIDAFDHVIAALDVVYAALAQFADPKDAVVIATANKRKAREAEAHRAANVRGLRLRDIIRDL